jgi:hypothetical protein
MKPKKKTIKQEELRQKKALLREKLATARKEFERELNERIVVFITTAFGVVAALFWQTAITDTIKSFIPVSGAWAYEILVAFAVTIIAVAGIFVVSRLFKRKL